MLMAEDIVSRRLRDLDLLGRVEKGDIAFSTNGTVEDMVLRQARRGDRQDCVNATFKGIRYRRPTRRAESLWSPSSDSGVTPGSAG